MKQSILLTGGVSLLTVATLSGCIDDNYDLSDIDTTTELKVNNLTLPINIAPITLGDIIKVEPGEQIQEITLNGERVYAIQESGRVESSKINISPFVSPAPTINPTEVRINPVSTAMPAGSEVRADFDPVPQRLIYKAENLDPAILSITDMFLEGGGFDVTFSSEEIENVEMSLENLSFTLPKGMKLASLVPSDATYDATSGVCTVPKLVLQNGEAKVSFKIESINMPANDAFIDGTTHDLTLDTHLDISEADVVLKATANATLPDPIRIDINYALADLTIAAISGEVEYVLKGIDIAPVTLANIPEFFQGDDSNVILANPQIYLSLNNPVGNYDLGYEVGLSLTSIKGSEKNTYTPDGGTFRVGYSNDPDKRYAFCLSPKAPGYEPEGFEDAEHVDFSTLGEVLSGAGLPDEIKIELPGTQIYRQPVEHFVLGDINGIDGDWEFLAPLALASDGNNVSRIIYTKTQQGWNDEDVDAIEISALELTASVESNLPVDAVLSGYPIDATGAQINGARFEPVTIPAGARNYSLSLKLSAPGNAKVKVTHLDGITYKAEIKGADGDALSPDQTLSLKNIKVKVSGNYTKEF